MAQKEAQQKIQRTFFNNKNLLTYSEPVSLKLDTQALMTAQNQKIYVRGGMLIGNLEAYEIVNSVLNAFVMPTPETMESFKLSFKSAMFDSMGRHKVKYKSFRLTFENYEKIAQIIAIMEQSIPKSRLEGIPILGPTKKEKKTDTQSIIVNTILFMLEKHDVDARWREDETE